MVLGRTDELGWLGPPTSRCCLLYSFMVRGSNSRRSSVWSLDFIECIYFSYAAREEPNDHRQDDVQDERRAYLKLKSYKRNTLQLPLEPFSRHFPLPDRFALRCYL